MRYVAIILTIALFGSISFADEKICDGNSSKAALVVIDMQPRFVTRNEYYKDPANAKIVEDIIAAQSEVIEKAKAYNIPVIFVEYASYGSTHSKLKGAAKKYNKVKFFKKDTDGMFDPENKYRTEFIDYLKKNNIGTLIIAGANGGACVRESIYNSLDGNCAVLSYANGIADFNRDKFIYPYSGYEGLSNCTDCNLKVNASLEDVSEAMSRSGSTGQPSPSDSKQNTEAVR